MPDESENKSERQKSAPKPPDVKAPAAASDRMSPREHALATGNGPKKQRNQWTGPGFSRVMGSVEHETAKLLHGWDDHEHELGEPIQLTRAEYLAALEATHPKDPVDKDGKPILDEKTKLPKLAGNPVPHPAALSPYKGKRGSLRLGQKPEQEKA
jgi:hypothetical protein